LVANLRRRVKLRRLFAVDRYPVDALLSVITEGPVPDSVDERRPFILAESQAWARGVLGAADENSAVNERDFDAISIRAEGALVPSDGCPVRPVHFFSLPVRLVPTIDQWRVQQSPGETADDNVTLSCRLAHDIHVYLHSDGTGPLQAGQCQPEDLGGEWSMVGLVGWTSVSGGTKRE
jgi:hypothetical protein